ncbi:MAG TPA: glycosyltransferase family 87 protein [Candidatus Polarisedimenticolia bacterium]|nr:glycosyltransferase family 87 protein [Candidatus Polarisedimenticolia bacterium]
MTSATIATRLTAERLRAQGIVLALCLWSVYLWNIAAPGLLDRAGNLKGADFLHFYTLGSLALAHRGADLYNPQTQMELAAQRVPAAAGIRFLPLYPPQVSILFAPFARLSYLWALALWLTLSALICGLCCFTVWRVCPRLRTYKFTVLILALAFPPFWHLMAWGQTSGLALACFTLAFFALRSQHEFLSGLAFGCLIFKPQLGLAAALVFLLTLRWKIIAGALLSASAELIVAWLFYGPGPLREWMLMLFNIPHTLSLLEPKPYQTHCLRTFWTMLLPWIPVSFGLYVISALLLSGLTVACWRRRVPLSLPLRYSALLFATVLLAPHLTVYDLAILAPAFLLLAEWIFARSDATASRLKLLLGFAFVLPLVAPITRWTHLQLSVPVMAALLYGIWTAGRKSVLATNQAD